MKIVFLNPHVGFNGGVKVVAIYAQELQRRGHDVLVVSLPPAPRSLKTRLRDLIAARPAPATNSGSHFDGRRLNHQVLETNRSIREDDIPDADAVVATWWETAEWLNAMSDQKGRKFYLVQGHEVFPGLPIDRVRATYRLPLKKIVVSRWLQSIMANEYDQHDVALVNNSVDRSHFSAPLRGKQPRPTVGFLFSEEGPSLKGCDVALEVIQRLQRVHANLRVISFGMPLMPNHLQTAIEFHQLPAQSEIPRLYAACDVWLTTSRSEGFNLTAMEAMACRTPVVSTRTGWPPEVIINGVNGYCVDIDDVDALTDSVDRVLRLNDNEWREMSARAFSIVDRESWDRAVDELETILSRGATIRP